MPSATVRQVTLAWALLVLLTIISMMAGHAGATGILGNGLVLTAAVVKGRWMLMDFLKLRYVPPGWRILLHSWLILIAAVGWSAPAIHSLLD